MATTRGVPDAPDLPVPADTGEVLLGAMAVLTLTDPRGERLRRIAAGNPDVAAVITALASMEEKPR